MTSDRAIGHHQRWSPLHLAALVLAAVVSLVGCTSSGGDSTSSTAPDDTSVTTAPVVETPPSTSVESSTTSSNGASSADASVVMRQTSFVPGELTVPAGTTMTWTNDDTISHTTTSEDGIWDSGTMQPGDAFELTLDTEGTYVFICSIHPSSMRGTVTVEA